MGKRILGTILLLIIFIPIFIIGGDIFNTAIYIVSLLALKEFIDVRSKKKELPILIKLISYIALSGIILTKQELNMFLSIDYRLLASIFMLFLIPTILYNKKNTYSVNDCFYLIGGILFLGMSFKALTLVRNYNIEYAIYLLLISTMSDTYAYITGTYIGKNKLAEVSPEKTIEGMIGGIIFGVFIPVSYYYTIHPEINLITLIITTIFLCILGIFGDLSFSAIKRHFKEKNFSNIIIGHGGILDRFDSIIFIVLGFMFCMNILGG